MADPRGTLNEALSDRYVLERELGRGGMAMVWLARDPKHDRTVAVKVLHPELSAVLGPERFLREIRLTAGLQHPHILPLLDSGEAGGLLYYVMPYVAGESLRQRLSREGPLTLEEALHVTRRVANALSYAHAQGVVHRDIKPENILLYQGEPMLADFGIALAAASAAGERLTETGLSLGTPAYMSPEQATADPKLDGRSDQYSLACVLYEMLAGEPPYTGPTPQAIIAKRFSEPVPHLRTLRELPASIDEAVTRALSRVPADRFPSVSAFATALDAPARKRTRVRVLPTLLAGVVLLAFGAFVMRGRGARPPAIPTHRQVTFTGTASTPVVSADSRWLAYVADSSLFVQDLVSATAPASVAAAYQVLMARWSPDNSRLFYLASDSGGLGIHTVSRAGGLSSKLASGFLFDLSGGGGLLYASLGTDSVAVFDAANGDRRSGFSLGPDAETLYGVSVSPDGRWLAFTGVKGSVTYLGLCRTDGSRARRLVEGVPRDGSLGWNRSSDAIYYLRDLGNGANVAAAGDVMKVRISPSTGEPVGEPRIVLGGAFVQEFSISPDGRQLAYTKAPPQQKIWAMTFSGPPARLTVEARELTSGTSIFGTPDISSDGDWVAFARNDGGTGNLFITPFDRYEPRLLVGSPADEWSPRWTPNGRQLAYAQRDAHAPGILVADVTTGSTRRVAGDGLAPLGIIAWMPSGRELIFPLDLGKHYAITDVATGRSDTLAAPDSVIGFHLTVPSPNGSHLAVNVIRSLESAAHYGLWTVERSGRVTRRHEVGRHPHVAPLLWTAEGWIYFLARRTALFRIRESGGAAEQIATLPQPCSFWQTALSADARRLVCTVSRSEPDIWIAENFDPEEGL